MRNATHLLIFHVLAFASAVLALPAMGLLICVRSRIVGMLVNFTVTLAALFSLIAFAVDLVQWYGLMDYLRQRNVDATLGHATWINLAAFVLLLLCRDVGGAGGGSTQTTTTTTRGRDARRDSYYSEHQVPV